MIYCSLAPNDDSDVYVVSLIGGGWKCHCESQLVRFNRRDMISHLRYHRQRGDKVPNKAIKKLEREIEEFKAAKKRAARIRRKR